MLKRRPDGVKVVEVGYDPFKALRRISPIFLICQ